VRSPIRYRSQNSGSDRAPPALGDSTAAVLAEFGYSDAEIEAMMKDGVIA